MNTLVTRFVKNEGRVAKIFGVENYAPSMGALRSDRAISGPLNRFTDLVEVGEQAGFTHEGLRSYAGANFREIAAPGPCFAPRKGRPQSRLQAYHRDKQD